MTEARLAPPALWGSLIPPTQPPPSSIANAKLDGEGHCDLSPGSCDLGPTLSGHQNPQTSFNFSSSAGGRRGAESGDPTAMSGGLGGEKWGTDEGLLARHLGLLGEILESQGWGDIRRPKRGCTTQRGYMCLHGGGGPGCPDPHP